MPDIGFGKDLLDMMPKARETKAKADKQDQSKPAAPQSPLGSEGGLSHASQPPPHFGPLSRPSTCLSLGKGFPKAPKGWPEAEDCPATGTSRKQGVLL